MEAIPLAALSIGGSSQAPIPATRDRVCLGQSPGDCRDRRSKRRGKTTVFHSHLREAGLRFINADDIARELKITSYEAAELTDALRRELVRQRESFVFDNEDLAAPFRKVAEFQNGKSVFVAALVPQWLRALR